MIKARRLRLHPSDVPLVRHRAATRHLLGRQKRRQHLGQIRSRSSIRPMRSASRSSPGWTSRRVGHAPTLRIWTSSRTARPTTTPTTPASCRRSSTTIEGRIHYIQIWNEPNLQGEWGGQPIDPAKFTDLLKAAYTAAKAADPTMTVLMPGLAPTDQTGPTNLSDLLFLQADVRRRAPKTTSISRR